MHADDTKIYLSHSEPQIVEGGINRDLESARLWFKENGMMPNPKKYQAIVLGRKISVLPSHQIRCFPRGCP